MGLPPRMRRTEGELHTPIEQTASASVERELSVAAAPPSSSAEEELCFAAISFGGGDMCTLRLPADARGAHVREALAQATGMRPEQLAPFSFIVLSTPPSAGWHHRRPHVLWHDIWEERASLRELQVGRGGAAVVLRLSRLRLPTGRPGLFHAHEHEHPMVTMIDFYEARERFVRGDFPLRAMDDVLDLAAGLLRLSHGAYDAAVHTPFVVRLLLRELMPPKRLWPEPRMGRRHVVALLLERHRRQTAIQQVACPHQLRVQWLELLHTILSRLSASGLLTSSRVFAAVRVEAPHMPPSSSIVISHDGLRLLDDGLRTTARVGWELVDGWKRTGSSLGIVIASRLRPLRVRSARAREIAMVLFSTHPDFSTLAAPCELEQMNRTRTSCSPPRCSTHRNSRTTKNRRTMHRDTVRRSSCATTEPGDEDHLERASLGSRASSISLKV